MADSNTPEGGLDPNVKIPDAIKAASTAADELHAKYYPPAEGGNKAPNGEGVTLESNETLKLAQEADKTPTFQNTADQTQLPVQPSPQPQVTPPAPQTATPQTPAPAQEEDWERRYRAMKGRSDHLANENRQLSSRLGNLEQTLATMAQPAAPTGTPSPAEDPTLDQITPQEISDYGEEFLNLVGKQARRTLLPQISKLEAENAQLRKQLGQVGQQVTLDGKAKLEGYLDTQLPTWRDLNYNEEFLGWLAQPDAYSGATRHTLLKQAYDRNDSGRVLAFFKGFLADEAATAPQTSSATNGAGIGNGASPPKVPLEKFAAPGRARTAAPSPAEKPFITRGQIAAFYAQVAAGAYAGNEAEKVRLENMIFDAQREGRIT